MSEARRGGGSPGALAGLLATRQFLLFGLAGGVAAIVHWTARIGFNQYMDFRLALVLAYAVGIATAYYLNKRFVFVLSARDRASEIRWFLFFNLAAFPLVWGASVLLAEQGMPRLGWTWHPREIAHAIAISLPIVLNFYLHKFVTFREKQAGA